MEWCESALEAAEGADVLVVLTEWNEFRALDLKRVREVMLGNVLVDLRNMYPEALAKEAGFVYHGIGRTLPPARSTGRTISVGSSCRRADDIRQAHPLAASWLHRSFCGVEPLLGPESWAGRVRGHATLAPQRAGDA